MSRDFIPIFNFWAHPTTTSHLTHQPKPRVTEHFTGLESCPEITDCGNPSGRVSPSQREVDSLSRRISKLIEENERVLVGPRQTRRRNSLGVESIAALGEASIRDELKAPGGKSPRRKSSTGSLSNSRRSSRSGPWRYEERILQLGYTPSKFNSSFSRRNSLPIDCSPVGQAPSSFRSIPTVLTTPAAPRSGRRASLPAISGGSSASCPITPRCLLEMHQEPELGASAAALHRPQRSSVIQLNPEFEASRDSRDSRDSRYSMRMERDEMDSTEEEIDIDVVGEDSDKEEDQPISDAQKLQATLSRKQSILRRWEAENGLSKASIPPASNHSTDHNENGSSRTSARNTPEAMEVENHPPTITMPLHPAFRESAGQKIGARVNADIFCTIEQIKKQAAAQRELLAEQGSFVAPQLNGGQPVMSHVTRNDSAPNAVVQLKKTVSPTPSDDQGSQENDESRPFRCNDCGVGFRIAGHLTRHYKSRSHLTKTMTSPPASSPSPAASEASSSMQASPCTTPSPAKSPPIAPEHQSGSRRFRCDVCDIGFRFQGHLDRHLRSTTHLSMEEAVRRNTKENS